MLRRSSVRLVAGLTALALAACSSAIGPPAADASGDAGTTRDGGKNSCGNAGIGDACVVCIAPRIYDQATASCIDPPCLNVLCNGVCCRPDQTCHNNSCEPPDSCNGACAGETPVCDTLTARCKCDGASCPTDWTCIEGKCCLVPCNGVCCGPAQVCRYGDCNTVGCSSVECNGVCCAPGQTCLNSLCHTLDACGDTCSGTTPECDSATRTCRCTSTSCMGETPDCNAGIGKCHCMMTSCNPGRACGATGVCESAFRCDPRTPSPCPTNQACYRDSATYFYECGPAGRLSTGSPCVHDSDCLPGMGCMGARHDTCLPYCDPTLSSCGPGKTCTENGDGTGWCG